MCVIFSVLCLVILALLTLGTSRQALQTSRLSLDSDHSLITQPAPQPHSSTVR